MSLISDVNAALQQAAADLMTYADYRETGDVTRAKKYVTALMRYLVGPEDVSYGGGQGERVRLTKKEAKELLDEAKSWIANKQIPSAGHILLGTKYYRD